MADTPRHAMRIPAHVWDAALAKAKADGTTLTDVTVRWMSGYAGIEPPPRSRPGPKPRKGKP